MLKFAATVIESMTLSVKSHKNIYNQIIDKYELIYLLINELEFSCLSKWVT